MRMSDPVRFGILGCGTIAPTHAQAIAAGGGVLIGAVSRRYAQAQAFAHEFSCRAYETYEAMLSDEGIDAVSVCTPTGDHFANARQALLAGKHVMVEKPMCLTLLEADALIALSKERGLCLGVISQSRFSDAAQTIRRLVDSGEAGRPVSAQLMMRFYRGQEYYDSAAWRGTFAGDGGGVIMNQGIHGIDLLCYLMGRPVSVTGYARTRLRNIEVEDTVAAALAFENGAVAVIDATTCSLPSFEKRFILGFEKGTIILENDSITLWTVPGDCPESCRVSLAGNTSADNRSVTTAYHIREYGNFIRHITEGEPLVIDGGQGRMPLGVILGVYESSRTGRRVDL